MPPSVRALARAPLFRFVVLGIAIFAVDRALARSPDDDRRIAISDRFVEGLRERHAARGGPAADDEALIREHAREEALYREARAAGLDAGDPIVRRRLVQKIEFVVAGSIELPEPDDATLERYLAAHASEHARPARTTLEHVLFARSRGAGMDDDARAALEALRADPDAHASIGDPFLGGSTIGPATDARIDATLGPGTAARIDALPAGTWEGPIEGSLGLHLVRVRAREPARAPQLDEVRERVRDAWVEDERRTATDRELDRIVASYDVVRVRE